MLNCLHSFHLKGEDYLTKEKVLIMSIKRQKLTYPAIIPKGLIEIDLSSLEAVFLGRTDTPLRRRLTSQLNLFIRRLIKLGVSGDLWINGSFATTAPEPMDVDVVLITSNEVIRKLNPKNLEQLKYLSSEAGRDYVRQKWQVDFYIAESSNLGSRRYYEKLFSRNPDASNLKGIPFVKL